LPFTLSHPAAVLPIHAASRQQLPLVALIIGSMAPDFAYFMHGVPGAYTHSWPGLVFCVPAGLLLYWVFHLLLKRPVSLLLPEWCGAKLRAAAFSGPVLPPVVFWKIIVALTLGTATHILWDGCTHRNTWAYWQWEVLRMNLGFVAGRPLFLYKLLQHLGTALGLIAEIWWLRRWLSRQKPATSASMPAKQKLAWMLVLSAVVATFAIETAWRTWGVDTERWLFFVAIASMRALLLALLFYSLCWQLWQTFSKPVPPGA
jgi:hypothetical protein